ncbi:MAG: hypothetical protein HQL45_15610 [Alphaproteobacteria bacterium]|nr:hypothetical protein [Alphaproteobacteria bacterium]
MGEHIQSILSYLGLAESTPIDSNTPLNIIRHLAHNLSYDDALSWATNFVANNWGYVAVYFFLLRSFRGAQFGIPFNPAHALARAIGLFKLGAALVAIVYGLSAASVLLKNVIPLTTSEFIIFCCWAVSAWATYVLLDWLSGFVWYGVDILRRSLWGLFGRLMDLIRSVFTSLFGMRNETY